MPCGDGSIDVKEIKSSARKRRISGLFRRLGLVARLLKKLGFLIWKHIYCPKYRKKVLYGNLKEDVRDIIVTLCRYKNVEIIDGAVCSDHIHLSVAIPPKYSISKFMWYLKGKSTLMIYDRHPELQSKWDKSFWARGYYVSTIGNITEDAIKKYIREQAEESRKADSNSTAL